MYFGRVSIGYGSCCVKIFPMAESEYPSILDTEEFLGEIG